MQARFSSFLSYKTAFILMFFHVTSQIQGQRCGHACSKVNSNGGALKALQSRSDTLDIEHTALFIDFTNVAQQQIKASCRHHMKVLQDGISTMSFDLLGLTVDSVKGAGQNLAFTHFGELLQISLPLVMNTNDTISLTIHYHGHPQTDASGWGGFYFSGNYAYNLGVGFAADPHSFGRAWFPCFDNFVERNTYSFDVLTSGGKTAYCNGNLISETVVGQDSLLTRWELNETIPSYLVSVAIGDLQHLETFYESISGTQIPMWLTAKQQDLNNVEASFVNLPDCMSAFEMRYGYYRWNRVGFVFVPFNSGAMEHATNISYPISAANGTLQFETLMAHELSHHWWGDAITCRTAEDMWLNEGWAKYSEAIFLESKYGNDSYRNFIRANHADVIRTAHLADGARLPVSGIGHEHTYGDHVYNKGADVAHTLRGYMGDDAFFAACQGFQETYAFHDVSSENLRDYFQDYTTANLTDFFTDRVFQPGYAAFLLEEKTISAENSSWDISLTFRQRLHYADELYSNVPYTLKLWDNTGASEIHQILLSGSETVVNIVSQINPTVFELDPDQKINDARLRDVVTLHQTGITTLNQSDFRINVMNMSTSDSLWLFIDNYWVAPDDSPWKDGFRLSEDRFWRIQGHIPANASITGRVNFWGNSSNGNYYDPEFFTYLSNLGFPEDSLLMLYRANPDQPWNIIDGYSINTLGSNTNMFGRIEFPLNQPGDYAWGIRDQGDGVANNNFVNSSKVYPNPSNKQINADFPPNTPFTIHDVNGNLVFSGMVGNSPINIESLNSGVYWLTAKLRERSESVRFVKH